MPTSRTYADACGIARALDVVGERWSLLLVRELLFGPQRFADLRRALPRAASNILTDRLRELEEHGVIHRRRLTPASWVYDLTAWGRELEPIVLALGAWGVRATMPPPPVTLGATSMLLYLRSAVHPDPTAPDVTYRLQLDERVWTVRTGAGGLTVQPGEPAGASASLRTTPDALNRMIEDPGALGAALAEGNAEATGDVAALHNLLRSARA